MAGTVTVSKSHVQIGKESSKRIQKVVIDWTADSGDGSVPNTSVVIEGGYVLKAITNPGSTAPTANYDIALGDPEDSSLDALGGALANRHTSTTEQVYPTATSATVPIWLDAGTYTLSVSNNSVNSATGRIILYLAASL